MLKKICSLMLSFVAVSTFLAAEIEYQIHDIGTLHTHSSEPIAINNQGQILGWYNIDGTSTGKHFFVREKNGSFYEIPSKENGVGCDINWRFLKNDGKAYGTYDGNSAFAVLYLWDQKNGVVKLGNLPGKEISGINDSGQVLIKSIVENENGRQIRRPVIWKNGNITKLHGLEGDIGIESDESLGLDMNNNGEVVGQSVAYLSYKNNIYKQIHAVKWVNGQAIDLHKKVPKNTLTSATAINDQGDVIVGNYLIRIDGKILSSCFFSNSKSTNKNYFYNKDRNQINDLRSNKWIDINTIIQNELNKDYDNIWMSINHISGMNDNGEVIAKGTTVYGEQHTMLLTPVKSD